MLSSRWPFSTSETEPKQRPPPPPVLLYGGQRLAETASTREEAFLAATKCSAGGALAARHRDELHVNQREHSHWQIELSSSQPSHAGSRLQCGAFSRALTRSAIFSSPPPASLEVSAISPSATVAYPPPSARRHDVTAARSSRQTSAPHAERSHSAPLLSSTTENKQCWPDVNSSRADPSNRPVSSALDGLVLLGVVLQDLVEVLSVHVRGLLQVAVVGDVELLAACLGAEEREQHQVRVDDRHEDADDLSVLVAARALRGGRKRVVLAETRLDRRRSGRDEVTQLVGSSDDERAVRRGRQLHEMDRDDAPRSLDAELLEEGGDHDLGVVRVAVRVQQRRADAGHDDDAEAAAENLRVVPDQGATRDGAEVGDHLRHGDLVSRELELVLEHRRVQVLRAVGLRTQQSTRKTG
ncbi:hypothetical protein ON010_g16101 [Phytophthora cinnamomi]|nr:hypothetical protein ON010_g16101 [Phytophthora cinnamomi]